jgi:hypothetical protein
MSSLLSNDFAEEFFRAERQLTKNEETFYVDREGKLIFTTPFETGNTIVDDRIITLDANHSPDNVNLIIDAISLFSTNPNIQNYLPLKFNFGTSEDSKPKIQFNSAESYTLTDYKVIVSPRVNLDTVQNRRYTSPINGCFSSASDIDRVLNVVRSGNDLVYSHYFLLKPLVGNNLVYRVDQNGVVNLSILTEVSKIYGNNRQAIGVENPATVTSVYNLVDSTLIETIGDEMIDTFLVGNNLIVVTLNINFVEFHFYFKRLDGTYCKVNFISTDSIVVDLINFYDTSLYFTYDRILGEIKRVKINPDNSISVRETIDYRIAIGETLLKLYTGGSNIDKPNISIFSYVGGKLKWYFFEEFNRIPKIKTYDFVTQPELKRYRNTAYFYDPFNVYLFNLDTQNLVTYSSDLDNKLVARSSQSVNFTDFDFIQAGVSYLNTREIITTTWSNSRNLKDVYKVSYNYDERIFPYHKPDNFIFTISLPNNNPIADMEIFKYVIDYRIRYSKESIGKPQATLQPTGEEKTQIAPDDLEICMGVECENFKDPVKSCPDGNCIQPTVKDSIDSRQGKCFRHCNRSTGSVSRILGYVGDEFNVEDFLNIYSTR